MGWALMRAARNSAGWWRLSHALWYASTAKAAECAFGKPKLEKPTSLVNTVWMVWSGTPRSRAPC